jgi:hypothetical protein
MDEKLRMIFEPLLCCELMEVMNENLAPIWDLSQLGCLYNIITPRYVYNTKKYTSLIHPHTILL